MKKISILIPAYNEENYIDNCLKVLTQINYPDYEIIVCDNNSTDNTPTIVKKYPKVILVHETNKGTNAARQRAFSVSTGEIVATIDADSIPLSTEDWIYRALKHFENQDVVAVSGICRFDGNYWYTSLIFWLQKSFIFRFIHFFIHKVLKKYALMFGSNAWYRRDALIKVNGFRSDIAFWGDDAHTGEMLTRVGSIIYDPSIIVTTSSRRYEKTGPMKTMFQYVKNYVSMWLLKRPITRIEDTDVVR